MTSHHAAHTGGLAAGRPALTILILWAAGLGAAAQYGKVSVLYDRLGTIYPEAGPALGLAVSLVGAAGILFGAVSGTLIARVGPRRALLWAFPLGAALSALQAALPPMWLFLASRLVEGAAHLAIVVAAPTLIAQIAPERHRGLAMTLWGSFFGVAFAVLAFAGLALVRAAGVPALFLAHAFYMAAAGLILARRLAPDPPPADTARPAGAGALVAGQLNVYLSPRMGAPALGWIFYTFSFISVLTLAPPDLPAGLRAGVATAMPLAGIATSLAIGAPLMRRVSAVRVAMAGFALALVLALALAVRPGDAALLMAFAAALGLIQGTTFAMVPELNADTPARARANGALAQAGNIGNTLGTPVMAAAIGAAGAPALGLTAAGAMAAGLALHLAMAAARRR